MDNINILDESFVVDAKGRKRGKKLLIQCPICENPRWVRIDATRLKSFSGMCNICHNKFDTNYGKKHPRWKGGTTTKWGYRCIKLQPDDKFYPMARKSGYVNEHRLVMAKHLGRLLEKNEIVHHINGIKNDNRIENLELLSSMCDHLPSMQVPAEIGRLKEKIRKLQGEIKQLKKRCFEKPEKGKG